MEWRHRCLEWKLSLCVRHSGVMRVRNHLAYVRTANDTVLLHVVLNPWLTTISHKPSHQLEYPAFSWNFTIHNLSVFTYCNITNGSACVTSVNPSLSVAVQWQFVFVTLLLILRPKCPEQCTWGHNICLYILHVLTHIRDSSLSRPLGMRPGYTRPFLMEWFVKHIFKS